MTGPRFSVVIPTYDRAEMIRGAVRSVLAQTFEDFELLIQDDGSGDGTDEVIGRIGDPRVRYEWRPRAGRNPARNAGAARAAGDYLVFLDSDDRALPSWLEEFDRALGPETVLASCGMQFVVTDPRGPTEDGTIDLPRSMRPLVDVERVLIRAGTFAVRRDVYLDLGGYSEAIEYSENTELSFRLVPWCLAHGREITAIMKPLVLVHEDRGVPTASHYRARLEACEFLVNRHEPLLRRDLAYLARYRRIAAANAARLGEFVRARGHLWHSFRARPTLGTASAALLTVLPLVRTLRWRGAEVDPDDHRRMPKGQA